MVISGASWDCAKKRKYIWFNKVGKFLVPVPKKDFGYFCIKNYKKYTVEQ